MMKYGNTVNPLSSAFSADRVYPVRIRPQKTPFVNAVNVCKIVNVTLSLVKFRNLSEDCSTFSRIIGKKKNNKYIK